MTEALASLGNIASTALGVITGDPVLMCFFCGGLLGVGFTIIKQAKRSARN